MTIREVALSDYEAVEKMALAMHRDALAHRPDLFAPLEEFYSPELFREWVSGAVCEAIWLIAEESGEAAGICLTRINDEREMFDAREPCVDLLYVREEYRRRGVARRLLEETERRAAALGCTTLTLCADGYNTGAMRLYEEFGMTPRKLYYEKAIGGRGAEPPAASIVPYDDAYRDDMIFMVLEAKNALGRVPRLNEDLLDVQGNYLDAGDGFYLALSPEGRVIGCVGYRSIEGTNAVWLHRFYVKASLRRRGIGSRLYAHAEKAIRDAGKTRIRVHLGGKGYEASRLFYQRFGYQYDGDSEHMAKNL